MKYKLNVNDNGDVQVKMKAGSDYVLSPMPKGKVVGIVSTAQKVEKSPESENFKIYIDDGKFIVDGELEAEEEPKKEDKWKK